MDDPNLLYEDLFEDLEDGKAVIKTSFHEMEDRMKSLSNEAEELRLQVRALQEQNEGLSKQNEVLIRNISCLFKTAQMEISRKDKQIRSFQEESQKTNVLNHGMAASTASARVAGVRGQPYLSVMATQAEHKGERGEACTTSAGDMGQQGLHGGQHGDYATMVSHGGSKDRMGETPLPLGGTCKQARNGENAAMLKSKDCNGRMGETYLALNGTWKQNNHSDAHYDQVDCKGDMGETPLASDGTRRRGHHRSGHRGYATMKPDANHKGKINETPSGTDKQCHYEQEHHDYAIKISQADRNGRGGESSLASDGIGKPVKSADMELQGDCKRRVKEMPLGSSGTGKLGHLDDKHCDTSAMASRVECKGREKETHLTSNGMENQDHRRGDHRDYAEKRRSCGKGSEMQDEMWKRRREGEYAAARKEHHRRRDDERYPLDAKWGEEAINAYQSLDVHKASERREKGNHS